MDDSIRDQIRDRVHFPDLVAGQTALPRQPNGRSAVMVRCPWHDDHGPSLAVYEDHAHCFGACGRSWDAFGWIMQRDQCDFPAALRTAASLAHITLPDWTPDRERREAETRQRQDLLTAVAEFYRAELVRCRHQQPSAYRYARSRGWSIPSIIRTGALGYAPPDMQTLLDWLHTRQFTPQQAASAGLLGQRDQGGGFYPRFRDRLVFPFIRAGRCVFLTGRNLSGRDDVPKWLHLQLGEGDHRPLYGSTAGTGPLIVVESPADALTLWQMGRAAVAVLGTTLPDGADLVLRKHRPLYVALDPDPAGRAGVHRLAQRLGPTCRVVDLPGGDCNAILQREGAKADAVIGAALAASVTYVERLAAAYAYAGAEQRDDLLDKFLDSLAALDARDLALMRTVLADLSGLGVRQLKELMKTHQVETKPDSQGYNPSLEGAYQVIHGHICRMTTNGPQPLTDWSAAIDRVQMLDDGNEVTTQYQVTGSTAEGRRLPVAHIAADKFAEMRWTDENWGVDAVIAPGQQAAVATAIKLLSKGAASEHIYTHTGWRELDGGRVFLHCGGAVGHVGPGQVMVDLGHELGNYRLPDRSADPAGDFCASLGFLNVGFRSVTMPLWAAMYQAPLSDLLPPRMVVWVYGPTNTYKSTTVLLAMRHFGPFTVEGDVVTWTSTDNAIELAGYMLKNCPMVIDDFAHQPNRYQMHRLQQTAERIIRSTGNEAGRWRMDNKRQQHRTTTVVRSLIISTGETLPQVAPSAHARILPLRFQEGTIRLERLTAAQAQADRYAGAMAGYILYLRDRWADYERDLRGWFNARRQEAQRAARQRTPRLTDAVCRNYTALHVALEYGLHVGAVTQAEVAALEADAWSNLMELAELQDMEVREESPVKRFCGILLELLSSQQAWLCPVGTYPDQVDTIKPPRAEQIGYQDDSYYWLLFEIAYKLLQQHASTTGAAFTHSQREMKQLLAEAGVLIRDSDDRYQTRLQVGPHGRPWCVRLDRDNFASVLE